MRFKPSALALAVLLPGCHGRQTQAPQGPLPPNTVLLSRMMRKLSAQPGFTEAFLQQVEGGERKAGAALLTPELVRQLRELILGEQWQGLDRFPGWTMRAINPTVRVVGQYAGRDPKLDALATAGGRPRPDDAIATTFIDLGDHALTRGGTVDLDAPATGPGFVAAEYVGTLGAGVTRGDGPNPRLAPWHNESARLAETLNRLSMNALERVPRFTASVAGRVVATPQELVAALAAEGDTVEVADARYFANFGHLHWNGQDVMMPFWVNAQVVVPHGLLEERRPLLVPVSHAEYEWRIDGPKRHAAVSFYFGIDGKAEWRTMDQLDQAWVMERDAHRYRDAEALEVTRLSGLEAVAYARLHQAHPALPFGGYYALGVCQDVVAAVELKLHGTTTLFPNTADASFFTNPADAEINDLVRRLPKDRDGRPPEPERIFGSLPVGASDAELEQVSIPGLGADLVAVHDAWSAGRLKRTGSRWRRWLRASVLPLGGLLAVAVLAGLIWRRRRPSSS